MSSIVALISEVPDDRARLDASLKRAYEEFVGAKFPRIRPREWDVLDDVQIDLDLEGGYLAGLVQQWLASHNLKVGHIDLDESIDERLAAASSDDAEATDTIGRFRSYRAHEVAVARCLAAAAGLPIRYWRRQ